MSSLRLVDVRADMPERPDAGQPAPRRAGPVLGVAVHHSATANAANGLSLATARSIFDEQVHTRGWAHGAYHYLVRPNGLVEYALDEARPGFHAGFADPDDRLGLERGQYWNNHYLAVCLLGWFDTDRLAAGSNGVKRALPNNFTRPTPPQWRALLALLAQLRQRHAIPVENIRGHRELAGCATRCPGANINLDDLRAELAQAPQGQP